MKTESCGLKCPVISRKQHNKKRFDKNEEIPDYTPPPGEKESTAQSKKWEKSATSLGSYNNPKNAPSENHYGLHGDGNWIDNDVRYDDYFVIEHTLPENRNKDTSLGAKQKAKESKKK